MKKLRIFGLALLIFLMTATSVFASNASEYVIASAGTINSSAPVVGQGGMGKVIINSSGGGGGLYTRSCPGQPVTTSSYHPLPADGGVIELNVSMPSGCSFQVHVEGGSHFPTAGTVQNYL